MNLKLLRRLSALSALSAAAVFLLSGCTYFGNKSDTDDAKLTWGPRSGYENFLELASKTYPNIELEFDAYAGANRNGYGWAQMRGDDIPDIFITPRIVDGGLAKERLVDLSEYDFTNDISATIQDQAAIDGGAYLLPINNTVYGIYYNKTLMEENNWEIPTNFAELEALCAKIKDAGLTPGLVGTEPTSNPFFAVSNLAKTSWLTTPEGAEWEQNFVAGTATAAGMWEDTMNYVQRYIDIGMYSTDPEDRNNTKLLLEELGNRQAVFCTAVLDVSITELPNGDKLGMMPYISEDGSKNIYMYSPSDYIGISSRLTKPGNEKKLEAAVKLLSLLYSPEGQSSFITNQTPCVLSVLDSTDVEEDALIYDAQQAQRQGRIFPMTYVGWENVLSDMGQSYKDWFRGKDGMDGPACITRMDEIQTSYLGRPDPITFGESTADFTLEETGELAGKVLGSTVGADAAMIPIASFYQRGASLSAGISGKLYKGTIDAEGITIISPGYDGEYAILTMTGAQAKELAEEGFELAEDKKPYPYLLVTKGGSELKDDQTYQVAFLMQSYTYNVGELYNAQVEEGSFRTFLREWLKAQETVSPDGNPWE